jgi:hypothetical protein
MEGKPGKRQTFERPFREHNSRGRLTAHEEFSRHAKPSTPLAMDCSVWLTVRPWRTECRTDPLRSPSQPDHENPSAKPCHCYQSFPLYHDWLRIANRRAESDLIDGT